MNDHLRTGMLILCLNLLLSATLRCQENIQFTHSFDLKLMIYDLEFFSPVERWLKITPLEEDDYLDYDLVLHSPPGIEMRIDIDSDHSRYVPTVEFQRALSSIATNDDDVLMEVTKHSTRYARNQFSADLAMTADFVPKRSFSNYPYGRLLSFYKEGRGMVKIVLLYEDSLDPYFNRPLKFKSSREHFN